MKLIIDFEILKKYDITAEKLLEYYYIYISDSNTLDKHIECIVKSFIVKDPKNISREIADTINSRFNEFRNKFKGLKLGSMGAPKSCREKLYRWWVENPEYSFDDILKASDIYIQSLQGDYRFLQRADYFIYKKEGKEESSRLSAFIDELEHSNNDWTSKLN